MIQNDLIEIFHVGDRYSIADVKRMLQTVYNKNEIIDVEAIDVDDDED